MAEGAGMSGETEALREALQELVSALDNAFISAWQSTAAWQEQLDAARAVLDALAAARGES